MKTLLSKLPLQYQWTLHNVVGHPLMGILQLVGAYELAEAIHENTIPLEKVVVFDTETTDLRPGPVPIVRSWEEMRTSPKPFDLARKQ